MAISYHLLDENTTYKEERWHDIQLLEGFKEYLYYDTANPTKLTIGFGFNVAIESIRDKVMEVMGLNLQSSNPAEQSYVSQIETLLSNADTGGPSGPATNLQSQLDEIMLKKKGTHLFLA